MTNSTASYEGFRTKISELADQITSGINDDYEKAQAIHDWVAENIYYDKDYLNGKTERTSINSIAVMNNRYAVCSGYANLTKDLLTAAGIPNREVIGYALGVSKDEDNWDEVDLKNVVPNHVWNEAYVDGRWMVIDATWDSPNTYEGGNFKEGDSVSELYFDVSVPFLSNTHKIVIP
jgi:transglutaminase/protease-like cytokinesis protein 3